VKPFVKTNKSDRADAEAIAMAAMHPATRTVPLKGPWHQDMQTFHKERVRLVRNRTALCNQLRALLFERGAAVSQGKRKILAFARSLIAEDGPVFTGMTKIMVQRMLREYTDIDSYIEEVEAQIGMLAKENPDCSRLQAIPGVGPIVSTAVVAAVPHKAQFRSARHFAAWMGLVPSHTGTGGKTRTLGISKRGNRDLRTLVVQGAGAVLRTSVV